MHKYTLHKIFAVTGFYRADGTIYRTHILNRLCVTYAPTDGTHAHVHDRYVINNIPCMCPTGLRKRNVSADSDVKKCKNVAVNFF